MPTIVMCSSKGGVGKSTIAALLAQVYAQAGSSVTLIDADPNQPLATWAAQFPDDVPGGIDVVGGVTEETIIEAIDTAERRSAFVIVDLEGSANVSATFAISRADLVLVPMRGKQLDANQAGRVVKLIDQQAKLIRRPIPYRIVFSMTSALLSKEERHIRDALRDRSMPILDAAVPERAAFSAVFQLGGSIYDLTREHIASPQKAIEAAQHLANAVARELTVIARDAANPILEEKARA